MFLNILLLSPVPRLYLFCISSDVIQGFLNYKRSNKGGHFGDQFDVGAKSGVHCFDIIFLKHEEH